LSDEKDVYLQAILRPIEGSERGGGSLDPSVYSKIRELRQSPRSGAEPNWSKIIGFCTEVLTKQSKDLAIAVELADAMAKEEGWAGLAKGLRVAIGLSADYWADLYPRIVGDDLVARANWFEQMEKRLSDLVSKSFMTSCHGEAEYQFWHSPHFRRQLDALLAESKNRKPMERHEKTAMEKALQEARDSCANLATAVKQSPRSFYEEIQQEIALCLELAEKLKDCVGEKFAGEPDFVASDPPTTFRHLRNQLQEALAIVEKILDEKPQEKKEDISSANAVETNGPAPIENAGLTGRRPDNRAQALRQLKLIAEFFRDTEPHSPVSYLAQRAAKWGEMSLETWLQEVVKEETTLSKLRETLGIPKPPA